jgi:small subunit ribosomal protein S14
MAKTSQIHRDLRRKQLILKHAARRSELREKLKDPQVSIEDKIAIQVAFAKLPRNSCPTRKKNRCAVTGRARGYHRKFGVSRIAVREFGLAGQLPGLRKSSW